MPTQEVYSFKVEVPYSVAISDELQKLELMNQPKSLVEVVRIVHRLENARKTL